MSTLERFLWVNLFSLVLTLAEFLKNDSDFQSCMIYGSESSIFGLKMGGVQKNAFNDGFYNNIFGKDVLPTNSHFFYSGKELQFGNEKKIPNILDTL